MNALFDFLKEFINHLRPWQTIEPWEEGIRIRFGKWMQHRKAGIHLQIPLVDVFHLRDVKPRIVNLPNQTVSTKDGRVVTVSSAMAYNIFDLPKTYTEVYDHEDSLINLAMGLLGQFIATHEAAACTLESIQSKVKTDVRREAKKWGVEVSDFYLTDLAEVAVIRLLQDNNFRETGSRVQIS